MSAGSLRRRAVMATANRAAPPSGRSSRVTLVTPRERGPASGRLRQRPGSSSSTAGWRAAGFHRAETAGARAYIAEDQKGGRAGGETLALVGAAAALSHGVQRRRSSRPAVAGNAAPGRLHLSHRSCARPATWLTRCRAPGDRGRSRPGLRRTRRGSQAMYPAPQAAQRRLADRLREGGMGVDRRRHIGPA